MRAYQVFAAMPADAAEMIFKALAETAPGATASAIGVAAGAMNARPQYLRKMPADKRISAMRRGLARVKANEIAEEILAVYFLECRKELLGEWLGLLGLEHEDGVLKDDAPECPPAKDLAKAVKSFRDAGDDLDREVLLQAFAAQTSIDWPELDALITPEG